MQDIKTKISSITEKIKNIHLPQNLIVVVIIVASYLVFFHPVLNPNTVIFSGEDSIKLHYPAKLYLEEKLKEGTYPFWTERMFLGFPLYEDIERGFMNIPNLILIYLFGAFNSYKILHFLCYFIGSYSLYLLLRKHSFSLVAFITANFIYFFNFLMIFHQQHFNLILVAYLLPAQLYIVESYFSENINRYKYLVLNIILTSFCFYLGYLQYVLLTVIAGFAYSLSFFYKSVGFKKIFSYFLHYLVVVLVLIIPAIVATSDLYMTSSRYEAHDPLEGSFFPAMTISLVHPFPFNREQNYQGHAISQDYNVEETYIYLGVTTVLFALFSFLNLKDAKLKIFIIFLLSFFVLTAFAKYLPLQIVKIFPFSIFRYWIRSVLYLNLSAAFLVGYLITHFKALSLQKKNLIPLAVLAGLLLIAQVSRPALLMLKTLGKFIIYNNSEYHSFNTPWLILLASSIVILIVRFLVPKRTNILPILISAVVITDLIIFGREALSYNGFKDKNLLYRPEICNQYPIDNDLLANVRVLDTTGCVEGDNAMIYKQWGLFGISTFTPYDHVERIKSIGLSKRSVLDSDKSLDYTSEEFRNSLKTLGIQYIVYRNGNISKIDTDIVPNENGSITNLVKNEGYIKFGIQTDNNEQIKTFIRNHPDWKVFVNGKKAGKNVSADNFINIPIPPGKNLVEVKFVPIKFLLGLLISSITISIYGASQVVIKTKRNKTADTL